MTHRMIVHGLVLVLGLTACSSKKEKEELPEGVTKEERDFVLRNAKRELDELQKGLADGTADKYACAGAMAIAESAERFDKDTGTKIRTLCNHDIPLATLTKGVPAAEEARKNAPDKITLSECSVDLDMAIEALDSSNTHDDASRTLVARYEKACPLNAQVRADRAKRKAAEPAPAK